MIKTHKYRPEEYQRMLDFLREVYRLNQIQHSWLPSRFEYYVNFTGALARAKGDTDWQPNIQIWETEEGQIVGALIVEGTKNVHLQIHPDFTYLEEEMIDWAEEKLSVTESDGKKTITIYVHDYDEDRGDILEDREYEKLEEEEEYQRFFNLKDDFAEVKLPNGFIVRSLNKTDIPHRCDVTAKALGLGNVPVEVYQQMQQSSLYRWDLDLIVTADDGQITAFCLVWFDKELGTGMFQPVGIHPDFQQKGLGKAIVLEGLRRLRALGAENAFVGSYEDEEHRMYHSAGLVDFDVYSPWMKEL